jgi:hypothetical protein
LKRKSGKIMKKITLKNFGYLGLALSLTTYAVNAHAGVREGGGGHFVFNPDGTVTIADSYYQNTTIVPTPIPGGSYAQAKAWTKDLYAIGLETVDGTPIGPMMPPSSTELASLFDKTEYYFVDVIPQVADCGLQVSLSPPTGSTVDLAACTSGNHTFIKKSDWFAPQVSDNLRAWLLVHELLRQVTGQNLASVEAQIMTVIQAGMLIEQIHSLESTGVYQSLTIDQTQLLEQGRIAVVGLGIHKIQPCDPSGFQGFPNTTSDCVGDIKDYAISLNGGGILPKALSNQVPPSSYVGAGSLIFRTNLIGANVEIVNSTFYSGGNTGFESGVQILNSNFVSVGNGLTTFHQGIFKNVGITVNSNPFYSWIVGNLSNTTCVLDASDQPSTLKEFDLPSGNCQSN